jgi:superoxide dismutase
MRYHYVILHKNYELKLLETLRGRKIKEESEIEKQFPTLVKLMENLERLPEEIRKNIRFFGGGLINHNFFFAHLAKFKVQPTDYQVEKRIDEGLLELIKAKFIKFEGLKREMVKSALQVQGSG